MLIVNYFNLSFCFGCSFLMFFCHFLKEKQIYKFFKNKMVFFKKTIIFATINHKKFKKKQKKNKVIKDI